MLNYTAMCSLQQFDTINHNKHMLSILTHRDITKALNTITLSNVSECTAARNDYTDTVSMSDCNTQEQILEGAIDSLTLKFDLSSSDI